MILLLHMTEKVEPMKTKEKADADEPTSVEFSFKSTTKKPTRKYRKGSKYDAVLDGFLEQDNKLVEVYVPDKDANYLRTQLNKRIEARNIKDVKVSVINNVCYLEK